MIHFAQKVDPAEQTARQGFAARTGLDFGPVDCTRYPAPELAAAMQAVSVGLQMYQVRLVVDLSAELAGYRVRQAAVGGVVAAYGLTPL
jgi:hypothetical protein